jgi:enoyl-CoA hydratase/carnithine racemase
LTRLERLKMQALALLHGHCLGLETKLVLPCAIRIVVEKTMLG